MILILANHVLASEGDYKMFVRMAGTHVSQSGSSDPGYIAGESAICIQWEGSPDYDSGYHTAMFPVTMKGLKEAHAWLDSWKT